MLAKVTSCALVGLEGAIVEVEVDISSGLPAFTNVGHGNHCCRQGRYETRSAWRHRQVPCSAYKNVGHEDH